MNSNADPLNNPGAGPDEPGAAQDAGQHAASSAHPGSADVTPGQPSALSLHEQLQSWQDKYAEMSESFLRAKAEAENARRRGDEEASKARKFAIEGFADSLLPVKDSLEAAIAIDQATPEQLYEGVHATLRQLNQALERNKVLEISPPVGTRFDPHHHQAISVVPSGQEANSVVAVLQKGYLISDRVLRPALVTVSAPK